MTLRHVFLVFVICCLRHYASSAEFCERYQRDDSQILGCVGFTDMIRYNHSLENVTQINFIKNYLPTLTPQLLRNFTSISKVFLTFNEIQYVEEDSFKEFTNATTISLAFNNIKELPETLFENNYNLLDLSLRRNSIVCLKEGLIAKLLDLQTIDLSFNYIESLSKNFFANNVDLELINLRENRLLDLPEEIFFDLSALKEIDLSYNQLTVLAPHVFKYNYNLEIVRVRGNRIKTVDYEVTHLNLQVFDLFKNPLAMDDKNVKETLRALDKSGVEMYLKKHKHGHKKESVVVAAPAYVKTILVILMFIVTLLLVAMSGLIVTFCTKIRKKTVRQYLSSDSQECLVADDNFLKLKIPNGVAVYVKNSHCSDNASNTESENGDEGDCSTSCDNPERKSVIV